MEFIEEAAFHEDLTAALLKNHDIITIVPEVEEHTLLRKLCEYYMCNAGIRDLLEDFEISRPSKYNKERGGYDYIVTHEDGHSLQLMLTATDVLKLELENYNISFTVH
jgi:hypothetical protein